MHKPFCLAALLFAIVEILPDDGRTSILNLSCDSIGPYKKFESDKTIEFTYKISRNESSVSESIEVYNAENNDFFYSSSNGKHSVTKGFMYSVSFPLTTSQYLSTSGMRIVFTIKILNSKLCQKELVIYPMESNEVHVTRDKIKDLKSKPVSTWIFNKDIESNYDDFNFINSDDCINANAHYYLDISHLNFLHNSINLNYESAYISLPDDDFKFKYFKHSGDNVIIPLKIENNGEKKSFSIDKTLYVNRLNLEASDYYVPDFVKTDKLYFPVNSRESFLGTTFQLVISKCGYNKYDLFFDLKYDAFKQLIGGCYASEYCVIGEIE